MMLKQFISNLLKDYLLHSITKIVENEDKKFVIRDRAKSGINY